MIIKFTCEYNGKDFCGFQRQKNLRTVQQVLEDALSKYFGEQVKIAGSGRTDTGVHAKGQTCSFRVGIASSRHAPRNDMYKVCSAINAFLPADVSVRDFEIATDDFHAQFSAKAKTYIYKCYVRPHRSALRDGTHLRLNKLPDMDAVRARAAEFVGTKSFEKYTTDKSDGKGFVRTIFSFDVKVFSDEIWFVVRGDGFLRKMVRILCGAVLGVGKTLPAHGLTLESVEY